MSTHTSHTNRTPHSALKPNGHKAPTGEEPLRHAQTDANADAVGKGEHRETDKEKGRNTKRERERGQGKREDERGITKREEGQGRRRVEENEQVTCDAGSAGGNKTDRKEHATAAQKRDHTCQKLEWRMVGTR